MGSFGGRAPGARITLEVGAIFIADVTRAGRSAVKWLALLKDCKAHDVMLVVNGVVHDLKQNSERSLATLLAAGGEFDNEARREAMMRERIAKAKVGKAVSTPPCGYASAGDGSWSKDPDPAVRAAIEAVFREFQRCWRLKTTVQALKRLEVKLPRRSRKRALWRVEPQVDTVTVILKHPAYKGEYHYRRCTSDPQKG